MVKNVYINDFKTIINRITKEDNVTSIILFGSRAKGTAKPNSDYDIAVIIKNNDKETTQKIESLKSDKYDIIPFQKIPLYVKYEVFKYGKILFNRSENNLDKEIYNTMLDVQDNYHHYWTLVNYRDEYGL